ncbi:MAG: hypothetical protein PHN88_07840 [Ignavibacteria bacterium]|nr:hypothetical protein [Ignavibacteria bacterium]
MVKYTYIAIFILSLVSGIILYGCDGLFPSASKPTVPGDHTVNYGGFLHKGGESGNGKGITPDECEDCHSLDLKGKVSKINGVYTWAPSCLQCHGEVWKRGGNNGNNTTQ